MASPASLDSPYDIKRNTSIFPPLVTTTTRVPGRLPSAPMAGGRLRASQGGAWLPWSSDHGDGPSRGWERLDLGRSRVARRDARCGARGVARLRLYLRPGRD